MESFKLSAYGQEYFFGLEKLASSRYRYILMPIQINTGDKFLHKLELIQTLKEKCNLTKQEADEVIKIFFSEMTDTLANGERVEIRGFCSLFVKEYSGYTGRNPKTGNNVQVAEKKLPFFKCGKDLKDRVDYL